MFHREIAPSEIFVTGVIMMCVCVGGGGGEGTKQLSNCPLLIVYDIETLSIKLLICSCARFFALRKIRTILLKII